MVTNDGKPMLHGERVFEVVDTHGIPLAMVLHIIHGQGRAIDWEGFALCALNAGWKARTIIARCEEALNEVYGPVRPWRARLHALVGG